MNLIISMFLLMPQTLFAAGADKEDIRQIVKKNLISVKDCYEEVRKTQSDIKGKILLTWEIDDQGKVKTASVKKESTLNSPDVHKCLLKELKSWKFPAAEKGKTIVIENYPMVFDTRD